MFEKEDYTAIIPFLGKEMLEKLDAIVANMSEKQFNKDEKMFYSYIEIGKILYKDPDFFYHYMNLTSPSKEEREIIHKKYDKLTSAAVVCRTAGLALLYVYKKAGLECGFVSSQDHSMLGDDDIHHWFVGVNGEDGKNYFCTLVPDLMNITFGNMVEHFCNEMPVDAKHNFLKPGIDYFVMEKEYIKSLYKSVYNIDILSNIYFDKLSRKAEWKGFIIESNPVYQELIKKYLEVFIDNPNNIELKHRLPELKQLFDKCKEDILEGNNFIGTVEQINRYNKISG